MTRLACEMDAKATRYEGWRYEKGMSYEIAADGNYTETKSVPIRIKDGLILNIEPIPEPQ